MVKQYKVDEVQSLVAKLKSKGNFVLTNYSGIKVKDLSILRGKIRETGAEYKVVKNTLFRIALKESGYVAIDDYLKGPIAVAFTEEDLCALSKVLKEFKKEQNNFAYTAGVMENVVYGEKDIERLADLPTKEVLLSQVMSLINGPASHIAMGMNQVMASLARGIKAVAEKNAH